MPNSFSCRRRNNFDLSSAEILGYTSVIQGTGCAPKRLNLKEDDFLEGETFVRFCSKKIMKFCNCN